MVKLYPKPVNTIPTESFSKTVTDMKNNNPRLNEKKTVPKQQPNHLVRNFIVLSSIVLITCTSIIYSDSPNNKFTNWDDEGYVTGNPEIKSMHGDSTTYSLKRTFSNYVLGNYHPLTILSYSLEYKLFKLDPRPYHVNNIILHILNTLLVLIFIWLLTKQRWTAFLTALLFSIHPMHVESVAWVSERKDVLYTFFSLASLCFYVLFSTNTKRKGLYYFLTMTLYLMALFSKGMAVFVPVLFVLIDYLKGIKLSWRSVLEKIPFFALSAFFGVIAVFAQKSANYTSDTAFLGYLSRLLFSSYSILMYLSKLFFPIELSGFYSYPITINGMYPYSFYAAPFILAALLYIVYWSMRKGRDIAFGFGFFLVSLVLVLKILPVGRALMADRYSYISYIGIFFIISRFVNNIIESKSKNFQVYKVPLVICLVVICISYSFAAFQRAKVWKSSISLWTDAINKNDKNALAYQMRGLAYYHNDQYEKALTDLSTYLTLDDKKFNVYNDRGLCYIEMKKFDEALQDFSMAIKLKKEFADAYYNKGIVYNDSQRYEEAIPLYDTAIQYNPKYSKAYYNRAGAFYLTGKYDKALKDALKAKELGYNVEPEFIQTLKTMLKSK